MYRQIGQRWHFTFTQFFDSLFTFVRLLMVPSRGIKMLPPFMYITGNKPGGRCNAAVPRPFCLMRVTVAAGTHKKCLCLKAIPLRFGDDLRIDMIFAVRDELNGGQKNQTANSTLSHYPSLCRLYAESMDACLCRCLTFICRKTSS